jgi:UTP--glucose-1-phosphate uridylyltransferase
MVAVNYTGKRYDMGNKLGILEAQVEVGLQHPQIGNAFRAYLKGIAKDL